MWLESFWEHFEVPNTSRQRLETIAYFKIDFEKIEKKIGGMDLALKYEVLSFGP